MSLSTIPKINFDYSSHPKNLRRVSFLFKKEAIECPQMLSEGYNTFIELTCLLGDNEIANDQT
ncbi:MAG: hypothetical protein ACJ71J_07270 [Nitrososphaeraceae archaeon]